LIYDVSGATDPPVVGDFVFHNIGKAGTTLPGAVVAPSGFLVRTGQGVGGSDRVVMTFTSSTTGGPPSPFTYPFGTVQNTWLQVDIGTGFGLAVPETHYWGNASGEDGNGTTATLLVNATDEVDARNNTRTPGNPAPVTFYYDCNKDRLVNATDQVYIRTHNATPATAVKQITK
jgi:hypothetical protein